MKLVKITIIFFEFSNRMLAITTVSCSSCKQDLSIGNKANSQVTLWLRDKTKPLLLVIFKLYSGQPFLHDVEWEDFAWISRIDRQSQPNIWSEKTNGNSSPIRVGVVWSVSWFFNNLMIYSLFILFFNQYITLCTIFVCLFITV